jgi:DNA polymerase IV
MSGVVREPTLNRLPGQAERGPAPVKRILHVDMNAFFVAVELLRRPQLRGLPVIVGGHGNPQERGVVATASYEARAYGVRSGMALRTAWRRCPDAVFLPVDYRHYARISERVKHELRQISHRLEDAGLDEAYIDISDMPGAPAEIGRAVKERIRAATQLGCSVGIGPNKLLAKLATDLGKPDGLTVLTEADIPQRVWPLPVSRLLGVGPKTAARLAELDVTTIGDLAALPLAVLVAHFGQAHGTWLHEAAHGIDASPLVLRWRRRSFSRQITFQRDVEEPAALLHSLDELCGSVLAEAQHRRFLVRTAGVMVRFADFETVRRQTTFADPTDDAGAIEAALRRCLDKVPLVKKVRLIGVRLSGLSHPKAAEPARPPSRSGAAPRADAHAMP